MSDVEPEAWHCVMKGNESPIAHRITHALFTKRQLRESSAGGTGLMLWNSAAWPGPLYFIAATSAARSVALRISISRWMSSRSSCTNNDSPNHDVPTAEMPHNHRGNRGPISFSLAFVSHRGHLANCVGVNAANKCEQCSSHEIVLGQRAHRFQPRPGVRRGRCIPLQSAVDQLNPCKMQSTR